MFFIWDAIVISCVYIRVVHHQLNENIAVVHHQLSSFMKLGHLGRVKIFFGTPWDTIANSTCFDKSCKATITCFHKSCKLQLSSLLMKVGTPWKRPKSFILFLMNCNDFLKCTATCFDKRSRNFRIRDFAHCIMTLFVSVC